MRVSRSRAWRRRAVACAMICVPALLPGSPAHAQTSTTQPTGDFWRQFQQPPSTTPAPRTPASTPAAPPNSAAPRPKPAAPTGSAVIARVGGRDITQAEFDRVAIPYFRQLEVQLGERFDAEMRRQANQNVLDELVRRELVAIEARRTKVTVTPAEVDAVLMQDPLFVTNGRFDAQKFNAWKTSPTSNYLQVLPQVREIAATEKVETTLRRRFTPTPAQVKAEWTKRSDQVRFKLWPLLQRDVSLEPEASEAEWATYYQAHPDQFTRRARAHLRYVRLPLPPAADSTRAAAEETALARARGIADSLRRGALPDSAPSLADTGPFDIPPATLPGLGALPGLIDTLARLERDPTLRVVGPHLGADFVVVGVVTGYEPKRLPPLREVLGDVKRRADAEKRRTTAEAERLAYYETHRDRWRGTRAQVTRVLLDPAGIAVRTPAPGDVDRWYAQHGRTLFGKADSSRAWLPPVNDSLRTVVRTRLMAEERARRTGEVLDKLAPALRTARDVRAAARAAGAVAETLSLVTGAVRDSLFPVPFADSLLAAAMTARGTFQGPRTFGRHLVLWRVDAADTAFVRPYELVRGASDQAFADDRRAKDEAEAQVYFDQHRGEFRTPVRYALDYVAVPIAPPDSVRVAETDLRRWYDTHADEFRQEEQVQARHILFMTRNATPEVERRAKARADSLLDAIRKHGGDFTEVAKRFSEEPGASVSGGDLGWFGRGRMVREFENAAFALQPGAISNVVKTQFGYHIIKVEARRKAGMRPFAEVRAQIRTQLAQARADSTARKAAVALRRRLAAPAAKTAPPAANIVSATPIAANEPLPGLGFPQGLAAELPGIATGRWAPGVYKAGNQYVAVRLREKLPQAPAPFDQVRAQAVEAMKNAKRRALLEAKVTAARAALAAGASLDSLAAPYGGLRESGLLGRASGFVPMVGNEPRLVERAFTLQAGQQSDTLHVAQGFVWLRVEERRSGDPATYAAASAQIGAELAKQRYDAWLAQRKEAVRIEILRPDLKAAARPAPPRTIALGG